MPTRRLLIDPEGPRLNRQEVPRKLTDKLLEATTGQPRQKASYMHMPVHSEGRKWNETQNNGIGTSAVELVDQKLFKCGPAGSKAGEAGKSKEKQMAEKEWRRRGMRNTINVVERHRVCVLLQGLSCEW
eukprot:scaffold361006_cov28-Prasinocladus_malaysianus.AAC.1